MELETKEDVFDAIVTLKVRGAPAIGITAAFGLALSAKSFEARDLSDFRRQFADVKTYLNSSRPTAVNLAWALDRLTDSIRMRSQSMKRRQRSFMKPFKFRLRMKKHAE